MLIARNYPKLLKYVENGKSFFVLGPRGTGKTSHLSALLANLENKLSIDLLNQDIYRRYLQNPGLIYKEVEQLTSPSLKRLWVMIDEVQLLPALLNEVHRTIEKFKAQCAFILTGSSARKLKREDANLLAGRAIQFSFFPLTHKEIDFSSNFEKIMQLGSLPESFVESDSELIVDYLNTYTNTYLHEEIQKESEIRRLDGFSRFLELAASDNGQPLNFAKIGRAAGISGSTAKQYFTLLEDTLIASCVPAWSNSIRYQLQQAPKYYFFDNGVLNALTGNLRTELRQTTYRYGRLFENLVVNELFREISLRENEVRVFHWRTERGQEIDLILQRGVAGRPVAVEIKSSPNPSLHDIDGFRSFRKEFPDCPIIVLCQTPHAYSEENVQFLPYLEGISTVFKYCE